MLQNGSASTLFTLYIYDNVGGYDWFDLQGTDGTGHYTSSMIHSVNVTFSGNHLNLTVDGVPEISNVAYNGGTAAQLLVETSHTVSGGVLEVDNFLVRASNPPPAPVLVSITPTPSINGIISLNWSAVTGAASYKVYRNSSAITDVTGLTPIATPSVNYTTDSLAASGTYWYAVVATNASGDSVVSNSQSVVVAISPLRQSSAAITPNPSTGSVQLNWNAVAGATSYKVYRNSSAITDVTGWTPIATPSVNYTTDSLAASGTYWYAVVATNATGDSVVSNT